MTDLHYYPEAFRIKKIVRYGLVGLVGAMLIIRHFR